MSKITNFLIDTSLMGQAAVSRVLTVKGKPGAKFIVVAIEDGTLKYYNFEDDLFELGHTPKSNLKITMSDASTYRRTISFPSGGGTYVLKLLAEEGTVIKNNKKVFSKKIEKQASSSTITLKPATVNTANYQTFPTVASTGSANQGASLTSIFAINNASTDAGGFGLKFNTANFSTSNSDPNNGFSGTILKKTFENLWYVQSTKAIIVNLEGTGVDSTRVTAANADGISIGMELFYHKAAVTPVNAAGDDLSSSVFITGITQGLDEVVITFNVSVVFENGETMTLRAYGSKNIYFNTGVVIDFGGTSIEAKSLVKAVREDSDGDLTPSTTITLSDTHGISGGNTISYIGLDVDNSSSNNVSVVTPDCPDLTSSGALDNDGSITVQLTQTLSKGTQLLFSDVHDAFTMKIGVTIDKHPESNLDVLFDLDKIITVGVSGS